jgi:beta-galactosidase
MRRWTRRDLVKTGLVASAGVVVGGSPVEGESWVPLGLNGAIEDGIAPLSWKRERISMDEGWRFKLGHACDPQEDFGFGKMAREATFAKSGATGKVTSETMDDSAWRLVDLPHDWGVELPFVLDNTVIERGGKPLGREYPATSIGWYRKVFEVPTSDQGSRLRLDFDGVFRDAMVFLNGHYLGQNFSGYAGFSFDITDFIDYGGKNIVAVRVDASLGEGWFYEGAGIYRHVWMTKTSPVHLVQDGVAVRTAVAASVTKLSIDCEVLNASERAAVCRVRTVVLDPAGEKVGTALSLPLRVAAGASATLHVETRLMAPQLWAPEHPHLYRLMTSLEAGGVMVDQETTSFGVRTIRFDAQKGFLLNGKQVKIKGTCNHQDHAGVGLALPDSLHEYRLGLLKVMGSNACRTSHNPPAPEFLDACDRLGVLVMDETRQFSSSPEGLSELERMVRRDRNHPSVVIWSLANEEPQQGTARGARIITTMKRLVRTLDPTRPVTAAMNGSWGKGVSDVVDVQGFNYGDGSIDAFRKAHPTMALIGTETASTVSTRGIYFKDEARGYVTAYDTNVPDWGATAEDWWKFYDAREWLAGGFVWTGFDYRGEPTPSHLPCISSHFGVMDTCGFPKDTYFYYKAWWGAEPTLHLFPHWNWEGREGQEIDVWCYCNQESVELFLDGRSLGSKVVEKNGHLAWKVPYAPGRLEARASKGGRVTLKTLRATTGAATKLSLVSDRSSLNADGKDAVVLRASVLDAEGREVPTAGPKVIFTVAGPAQIIGVGNGDPSCHEADKAAERSAFNGLCMAVLQAKRETGSILVRASSPGLESATLTLLCNDTKL